MKRTSRSPKFEIAVLALLFVVSLAADSTAQPWVARHGMTSSQYQAEFDTWTSQGFRLTDVSGYDVAGTARFAAIWVKKSGPAWVARHGMTSAEYQSQFNTWVGLGYRLVVVDGYDSGGQARYAALWELKSGPPWVARHGMTSGQYQAEFDTWVARGYRLKWVQGYGVGGTDYYAAIWEQVSGPAWVAHHGMTSATYQGTFNAYVAQGYRLTHVSGYNVGGTDYYAAIWERSSGPAWVARHGMTSQQYQQEFDDLANQGYRLKLVDGYAIGGSARYAAIWEAQPTRTSAVTDRVNRESVSTRATTVATRLPLSKSAVTSVRSPSEAAPRTAEHAPAIAMLASLVSLSAGRLGV